MTLELTLGRTTFMIRRNPVKKMEEVGVCQPKSRSFTAAWVQIFNGTWEAKAGACFPKQMSAQCDLDEKEEKND